MDGMDLADGAFFAAIALMLATMTVLQLARPTVERRASCRSPRPAAIGCSSGSSGAAYIHLAWLGLSDLPLWYGSIVALIWFACVMRWG